jgi:hypothetical protein
MRLSYAIIYFRPFKGLIDDIKRKAPHYLSDYKDAIHIQCLASFVYVFLGTLTPNVTFGGLLGQATDQYMVRCFLKWNYLLLSYFKGKYILAQPINIHL